MPSAAEVNAFIESSMLQLKPIVVELVKVAVARAMEPPKEEEETDGVVAEECAATESAIPAPIDIVGKVPQDQLRYQERLAERDACRLRACDESDRLVEAGLLSEDLVNDHVRHALDDFDQEQEDTDSMSAAQHTHRFDDGVGLRYGNFTNSRFCRG